jgi:hypothetical protein
MQFDERDRRNPLEHDILVARRHPTGKQYFKITGVRETGTGGRPTERAQYTKVEEQLPSDSGYRGVVGFACAETQRQLGAHADAPRGPALATLPLHPDPTASASCTCYLLNPENVTYETSWTTEEWSDQQVQPTDNPIVTADAFELLVAGPAGKVYLISKAEGADPVARPVPIEREPELWSTLRGGTVAGSVRIVSLNDTPRVIPVVNVQALMPSKLVAESAGAGSVQREVAHDR